MRRTPNQLAFDHLPADLFWKTDAATAAHVRGFEGIFDPGAVGYDAGCDGFVAVHSGHSRAALVGELPVCLCLKKRGFGVVLLEESGFHKSPDVQVAGLFFEIKTIRRTKNLKNALMHQFRSAKSQSKNLIVHIDMAAKPEQLRANFFHAASHFKTVRLVWVFWRGHLYQFSRTDILAGRHQF